MGCSVGRRRAGGHSGGSESRGAFPIRARPPEAAGGAWKWRANGSEGRASVQEPALGAREDGATQSRGGMEFD